MNKTNKRKSNLSIFILSIFISISVFVHQNRQRSMSIANADAKKIAEICEKNSTNITNKSGGNSELSELCFYAAKNKERINKLQED